VQEKFFSTTRTVEVTAFCPVDDNFFAIKGIHQENCQISGV